MGYAHRQNQLREHWHPHHARVSHYQQSNHMRLVFSTSHQYFWTRFVIMDRNENCPTLTMNQFTLSQHVSDSQAQACSLLCHQHQIVS